MRENEWNILAKSPLFAGIDREELETLLSQASAYQEAYQSGDAVDFQHEGVGRIGVVLSGGFIVQSAPESEAVLNTLKPADCFGVSVLYQSCGAKTRISCQKAGKVLFLDTQKLDCFWESPHFRENLIGFLTDRIRFLNQKIACFTASGATQKLSRHLLESTTEDNAKVTVASFAALARTLDLGRASLYRAMESLEEAGAIKKEQKQIRVLSRKKLINFIKK